MALLARRVIGDVAHRIDRLARRARGHKRALTLEGAAGRQHRRDGGHDLRRLRHAAGAVFVAGHRAIVGTDEGDAALLQGLDVGHGRGMRPHADVHRGCDQYRLVGGEQHGRGKIVGHTRRHARQNIGRSRRDHEKIGVARQLDVAHLALVAEREHVGVDLVLAERLKRQRRHEPGARVGQHAAHMRALPAQLANEVVALESRDAARDNQQDPLVVQHGLQDITTAGWRKYRARSAAAPRRWPS